MEIPLNQFTLLFFHIAGIIVGLGAVTVIDTIGFLSRKSKSWTQIAVKGHHVTKLLIWIGTILLLVTWIFMLLTIKNLDFKIIKSLLIIVLLLNGSFLSLYVSPRVDEFKNKNVLFSKELQSKTIVSMVVSFLSWWSFVIFTIIQLLNLN